MAGFAAVEEEAGFLAAGVLDGVDEVDCAGFDDGVAGLVSCAEAIPIRSTPARHGTIRVSDVGIDSYCPIAAQNGQTNVPEMALRMDALSPSRLIANQGNSGKLQSGLWALATCG